MSDADEQFEAFRAFADKAFETGPVTVDEHGRETVKVRVPYKGEDGNREPLEFTLIRMRFDSPPVVWG